MPKTEAELRANRNYVARQKAKDPEGFARKQREKASRSYWKNPEAHREAARNARSADVEKSRAYYKELYYKNRDACRAASDNYKAKVKDTPEYKAKVRNWNYKRMYGITTEEWDAKFAAQGFVCEACGSPEPRSKRGVGWATDHDHETGKLRGIICVYCNVALGKVEDKIERLEMLISYLRKYDGN